MATEEQLKEEISDMLVEDVEAAEGTNEAVVVKPEGDPCNSYQWSIIYLIVLSFAIIFIALEVYILWKRRAEKWNAMDIAVLFLFTCTIIQFGPMLTQVLHAGHQVSHYSQTGCKLLFFTDYGMRHVVAVIVIVLVIYAWLVNFKGFNKEQLDNVARENVAWFILGMFAIEGVFGMPAAIYVDVDPTYFTMCIWTRTMTLTVGQIISMEMLLRPVVPYMIPSAALCWPLVILSKGLEAIEVPKLRSQIKTILLITWTYILLNLPYSILLITEYVMQWVQDTNDNWAAVCNAKWFFFLLHQGWFLLVPLFVLNYEINTGHPPPGLFLLYAAWDKLKSLWTTVNEDRTMLV